MYSVWDECTLDSETGIHREIDDKHRYESEIKSGSASPFKACSKNALLSFYPYSFTLDTYLKVSKAFGYSAG